MTLIGAIGNSLLHSVVDRCVSMVHVGMTMIGATGNNMLYIHGDKLVILGHGGMH
jgi:hypothetical protein